MTNDGLISEIELDYAVGQVGSPSLPRVSVQAGVVTGSGGVAANGVVHFGTPFAVAPTAVILTPNASGAVVGAYSTGIAAGSFTFRAGSNVEHSWIAIGSGRI